MDKLSGMVAIVTGGASGIGAATVQEMARQGAQVLLTDINAPTDELVRSCGDRIAYQHHDVTNETDWKSVIDFAEQRFGPVTALVNNAGIIAPGNNEGPIEDIDILDFRRVLDVNQVGTFLGIKHVVPSMRRAGKGAIVNISSAGGLVGTPFTTAYSATKWAVVGLTKCAALELGRYGIRVNSVHPGAIWTPIHHLGQPAEMAEHTRSVLEKVVQVLPLPRLADPVEVARMIAFVASDDASYSTGSQFVVDGGLVSM
ncbi:MULTISPECIES: SDR family NAD(P)-dependent oxidoreductase [Sphingobium]|uniref:SDR family NAD(P)-dependent oxidoreductase n=1 Tax=Sphingobium sp. MI1205 TaxID=407020 RepID=UPI00077047DE|nr:glucose 1-dehydrogenase [Sphingobium sp. MI1205]AMK19572.1 short-chain dehydrogenase/reductase SDR [Sphingobium sp. MI1205]